MEKSARLKPCPFCPKTFSTEGLKAHLISDHLDLNKSKEKPNFRCDKCDKNFKLEKNYKRHIISLHESDNKENEINEIQAKRRLTLGTPKLPTRVLTRRQSLPLILNNAKPKPESLRPKPINSPLATKNSRLTKLLANKSITVVKDQTPKSSPAVVPSKLAAILKSKSVSITTSPGPAKSQFPKTPKISAPSTEPKPKPNVNTKSGSFSFKCQRCQKEFNQVQALQLHIKEAHGTKYPCKQCQKIFAKPADLKIHATRFCFKSFQGPNKSGNVAKKDPKKSNKNTFDCGTCGKSFTSVKFLENHAKAFHKGLTFHCFKCGQNNFDSFSKLLTHISLKHKSAEKSGTFSWTCPKCEKYFDKELPLLIHMGITHPEMKSTAKSQVKIQVKRPRLMAKNQLNAKEPTILTMDHFQSKAFQPQVQLKRLSKKSTIFQ